MDILKLNSDTLVVRIKTANIIVRLAGIYNILGRFLEIFRRAATEQELALTDPEFLKTISPKNIYSALLLAHRSNDPDTPLPSLFQIADTAKREGNIREEDYNFLSSLRGITPAEMMETSFPERAEHKPNEGILTEEDAPIL